PPPASGAGRLAGFDRARARCAADGWIAFLMQRIDGNSFGADEIPQRISFGIEQWIKLDEVMRDIPFRAAERRTIAGLLAAQAADPDIRALKRAAERFDLADMTTSLAVFDAFIKPVDAVRGNIARHA